MNEPDETNEPEDLPASDNTRSGQAFPDDVSNEEAQPDVPTETYDAWLQRRQDEDRIDIIAKAEKVNP